MRNPFRRRLKIVSLERTSIACPSQWEGRLADGRFVFIRERWGTGHIQVGDTEDEAMWGKSIHRWETDSMGWTSDRELHEVLAQAKIKIDSSVLPVGEHECDAVFFCEVCGG